MCSYWLSVCRKFFFSGWNLEAQVCAKKLQEHSCISYLVYIFQDKFFSPVSVSRLIAILCRFLPMEINQKLREKSIFRRDDHNRKDLL